MINQHRNQRYLGDGVYARFDGFHIVLYANDPLHPTDTIYLEEFVIDALTQFAAEHSFGNCYPEEE